MHRVMLTALLIATGLVLAAPRLAEAHCDTLDGPVVTAARHALDTGDVRLALIWVTAESETEIREAFARTLEVRQLGPDARALADRYFFETLVRVHRNGEGEPYTGLKPAGARVDTAIAAADRALESGVLEALDHVLTSAIEAGLRARFEAARKARAAAVPGNVESGRRAVAAYVTFIHFAEQVYGAAELPPVSAGDGDHPDPHGAHH